jgi:ribosomal protein L3 glutamine methyltransferase
LTLGELLKDTERRFRAAKLHYGHGTDNPKDEAAYLVLGSLRLPFERPLDPETRIRPAQRGVVERLIRRRIRERIPVAYLLNEAWLDGRAFYVDRRVIIPRSHIAFMLKDFGQPRRVLDLCTGSGCLAILAAYAFPKAEVHASDISAEALVVAKKNILRHQKRIKLLRSDLFEHLVGERYDLIISNPPYVPTRKMRTLPREYRYEPGISLAGGGNGLSLVKEILAGATDHLTRNGLLVCEMGAERRTVQRAFPALELSWPVDQVFLLERAKTRWNRG